jgi:hypothetical protein
MFDFGDQINPLIKDAFVSLLIDDFGETPRFTVLMILKQLRLIALILHDEQSKLARCRN